MDENAPTRKPRKIYSKDNKILLLLKDGSAKLQQIISLSGLGRKTVDKTLRKLIGYDLVERLQWGYYGLTPRGKEHVSQLRVMVEPVFTHKDVVQLIAKFPTEAHQAFLRLLICGVAAKRLLFDYFDDYFPAFLAYGRTRTLKTFMAKIVCKLFGLDPEVHIRLLDNALPKEVEVRRIRAGGQTRYAVVGSKYFDMEFVCFDEWNHADRKLRDAALSYADGRTRLSVEDGQIVNRVCCMITSNTDRKGIEIPDSYVRRSVMLDTDPLASELKDAGRIAREISNAPIPRIELDGRQVQVTKLEDEDYELLESLLKSGVREDAWGVLVDVYPVEILTLGHLALSDSDDVKASIYGVAYDRLAVLETLGATVEGWRDPLLRAWAAWQGEESSEIAQRRVEAEQKERETRKELEEREQEIEEGGTEDLKGRLEFVRARAELVAEVERLSEGLPQEEGWQFATKPVWDMLDVFIREVEGQEDGTLEELEEYRRIFDREIRPKLTHVCTLYVVKEGQRKEAEWQWQEEQERLQERKEDLIGKLEGHLARLMPYRKKKEQEEARGEKTEIRFLISKIKHYVRGFGGRI